MISESVARSRRLFWLGRSLLALSAILLPVLAYGLAALLVDGHAQKEYFEAISQILPVLLLALAIEQRYFTRGQSMPELPPELQFGETETASWPAGTRGRRGSTRCWSCSPSASASGSRSAARLSRLSFVDRRGGGPTSGLRSSLPALRRTVRVPSRRGLRAGALPPIPAASTSCGIVKKPMSLTKAFGASQPMIGPWMKL